MQIGVIVYPDPKLLVWPDSIGYLGPAVDALERGYFSHWYGRAYPYPLFLLGLLSISPEPVTIVYAQRALVFATYVALASTVWLLARHAARNRLASPLSLAIVSGTWLLIYIFYPPTLFLAHAVMAETLFSFLLAVVMLAMTAAGLPETSVRARGWAIAVACVVSVLVLLVRPHWLVAGFLVPLLLVWLAPPGQRRRVAVVAAVASLSSFLVLVLPEKSLQGKYDAYTSKVFGPKTLFCNSADLVHDYLARAKQDDFNDQVRASLAQFLTPGARAAAAVEGWGRQGFNGDKCVYGGTAELVSQRFARDPGAEASYYFDLYLRAVAYRPGYLVHRLGTQLASLGGRLFPGVASAYSISHRTVADSRDLRRLYEQWVSGRKYDLIGLVETPFVGWETELSASYFVAGAVLASALVAFLLHVTSSLLRGIPTTAIQRHGAAALMLGIAINGLIAVVHTFDVWRYASMQAPLFTLLGVISFVALGNFWKGRNALRTALDESPQGGTIQQALSSPTRDCDDQDIDNITRVQ
ncbi:MAG TPA: hypothetical protein VJ576_02910 [Rhodocyclaceae bacterium]|nr:hypothetical protein [Rhodocyclaceae bacterium]